LPRVVSEVAARRVVVAVGWLGQLVGAGLGELAPPADALFVAAVRAGLEEREARATIAPASPQVNGTHGPSRRAETKRKPRAG